MPEPNLNIHTRVSVDLSPKLRITPQMKQSLGLLQKPLTELKQEVLAYIQNNPALEADYDTERGEEDGDEESDSGENEKDPDAILEVLSGEDWKEYIAEGPSADLSFTPVSGEDTPDYEQMVSSRASLSEHLMLQLKEAHVTKEQLRIGAEIIGNLTEEGYFLDGDAEEVAEICGAEPEEVEEVLYIIRGFDPLGIAASGASECMLAQLSGLNVSEGEYLQIREILLNFSKEIAAHKLDEVAHKSGLERENVDEIIAILAKTDPKPALGFSDSVRYVTPDVYIIRTDDGFDVVPNEEGLPRLALSSYCLKMLKSDSITEEERAYIKDKVSEAVWVINSLTKRHSALYRVTKAIVEAQKEFLLKGEAHFKPLRLKDVAVMTGLHEATISRVTGKNNKKDKKGGRDEAGKYVMTERGLMELKSFFSKGMQGAEGNTATRKIKTRLKELVEKEAPDAPLSDDRIVKKLTESGMPIARRTVTKYREELNIPTMSERKRMKS